jgi:tetratricopeptide (TPR) repeat protein
MIFHRPESTFPQVQEFTFKHAILHDVTYATVLKPQRRRYHALAAAWLIERSGERAAEFAGVIARHLQAAGQPQEAATWFGTAGERALATFAPAVAIHAYEQALALAPGRMGWLAGLAEALWQRAEYRRSAEAYQQMLAAAQAADDNLLQARALNGLSLVYERQHELQVALEHAVQAAATARRAGDPAQMVLAEALFLQGWSLYRQNRSTEAISLAEQSLALCGAGETPVAAGAQQAKLARVQALNLSLLGSVHSRLGNFERANAFGERAYELYLSLGDRRGAITVLNNMAVTAHLGGRYAEAAAGYRRVLELCHETGNQDLAFGVMGNLAEALVDLQQYAEAEALLLELLENKQGEARVGRVKVYRYLAEAQWGLGRSEAAWASALAGLEHAGQTPSDYLAGLWRVLGQLAAGGPPPVACTPPAGVDLSPDACFARALADAGGNEAERAAILRDWGGYRLSQGDEARGRALWQEARARFEAAGLGEQVARMDRRGSATQMGETLDLI